MVRVDSEASQVWPLCAACLSDDLKPLPKSRKSMVTSPSFKCQWCQARIERPCTACEVIVELELSQSINWISASNSGPGCIKVCVSLPYLMHKTLRIFPLFGCWVFRRRYQTCSKPTLMKKCVWTTPIQACDLGACNAMFSVLVSMNVLINWD